MSKERCHTCGRQFANRTGLGVHQARSSQCHDPDASRRRAREREARYRARHPERRRQQVRESQRRLRQRAPDYFRAWREAHADGERERKRRWRASNPELLLAQRRRRRARKQAAQVPLPPSHVHHPLFDEAWKVLHRLGIRRDAHLVAIRDPRWEDACSEVVLALIEGRDPEEAAREVMATEKGHAARTVVFSNLDQFALAG
jgi:hypothetical protein